MRSRKSVARRVKSAFFSKLDDGSLRIKIPWGDNPSGRKGCSSGKAKARIGKKFLYVDRLDGSCCSVWGLPRRK